MKDIHDRQVGDIDDRHFLAI